MPPLMRSELPVVTTTRHHPIVLLRRPGKWALIGFLALVVWALMTPSVWFVVVVLVAVTMGFRWQTWKAEQIILTRKRIIRVQGVPETTTSEAFLRVDRVSGMRLVQSVPGKLFDYANIELEAPGNHPDVRHLIRIWHPHAFYRDLRHLVFSEQRPDPDEVGSNKLPEDATAPLPRISAPTQRKR